MTSQVAPLDQAQTPALSKLVQPKPKSDHLRRYSLPLNLLPPSLWSANASSASLVESEEAARGEHIVDEAAVANRISALRQLNGGNRARHRYSKSTGARNSTFSQPVIVRTYSGPTRPKPPPQRRDLLVKKENGYVKTDTVKMDLKLPPVEAFTFKGIMDEIRHGVAEDLERIAEICAKSKYSLSNQYEVHMPPHGLGNQVTARAGVNGPTLQAISSDDEPTKIAARSSRGSRRSRSIAYGTLETIMSSSKSSDEDKSRKKPAAVLAEEVRGRAAQKELEDSMKHAVVPTEPASEPVPAKRQTRHVRSKSATFASIVIDNAQSVKQDSFANFTSPISLISEPARPQTSNAELETMSSFGGITPSGLLPFKNSSFPQSMMIRNASVTSILQPSGESRSTILRSLSSWLPWSKPTDPVSTFQQRARSGSNAEGILRDLLNSTGADKKGKGIARHT